MISQNDDGQCFTISSNNSNLPANGSVLHPKNVSAEEEESAVDLNSCGGVEEPLLDKLTSSPFVMDTKKEKSSSKETIQQNASTKKHDPHTITKRPTSFVETLIHLLKGNIGSGMFAMGDAFKNAGIIAGPVLTLVLGIICIYNNHVLVNCAILVKDKKKMERSPNFPETVEMCFELGPLSFRRWTNFVRRTVTVFVIITQLGFCCVYFVFVSSTIKHVVDPHNVVLDVRVYMLIMFVPVLATCLIRSLKMLAPISLASNICVCSSVFLTLYLASSDLPPVSSRPWIADLTRLPLFLGTTVYAFEGISLILPLQNEMKNKHLFATTFGVLNLGLSIVTALLIIVGFIGYLKYGEDVQGSLSLNLPPNQPFSDSVQVILSVGIVFSYALQFYVAADIIWSDIDNKYGPFKHPMCWETLLRTALVLFTMLLAAVIPKLGLFISLIGAVSSTALALVSPALCDIALRCCPREDGPLKTPDHALRLFLDGFTLLVAVIVFIAGTYCSLAQIVQAFATEGFTLS